VRVDFPFVVSLSNHEWKIWLKILAKSGELMSALRA
jgi:hypothetical protein